jgi:hypothetical protein
MIGSTIFSLRLDQPAADMSYLPMMGRGFRSVAGSRMTRTLLWSIVLVSLFGSGMALAQTSREGQRLGPRQEPAAFLGHAGTVRPLDALLPSDPAASGIHAGGGPLSGPQQVDSVLLRAACGPVTFDQKGRPLAVCADGEGSTLHLFDPNSLKSLASLPLPAGGGTSDLQIDAAGRVVLAAGDRQVWTVRQVQVVTIGQQRTSGSVEFEPVATCDLSAVLPASASVVSAVPAADGLVWFAASSGDVGTVRQDGCAARTLRLGSQGGEIISQPIAVDPGEDAAFVVSDHALYRLGMDDAGQPRIAWRQAYERGARRKPGKAGMGSGTAPVLIGPRLVAIADNADPLEHLLVFERSGAPVCAVRLFASLPMRSAVQGKLAGFAWEDGSGASVIVSNQSAYRGLARVDIDLARGACRPAWTSDQLSVPSGAVRLALGNGLIYAYGRPEGTGAADAWYLSALDFRTGAVVFHRRAGTGAGYADDRAGVALAPDGTAFIGTARGLVRIEDRLHR